MCVLVRLLIFEISPLVKRITSQVYKIPLRFPQRDNNPYLLFSGSTLTISVDKFYNAITWLLDELQKNVLEGDVVLSRVVHIGRNPGNSNKIFSIINMLIILDGNSGILAHLLSKIGNLICSRHLIDRCYKFEIIF